MSRPRRLVWSRLFPVAVDADLDGSSRVEGGVPSATLAQPDLLLYIRCWETESVTSRGSSDAAPVVVKPEGDALAVPTTTDNQCVDEEQAASRNLVGHAFSVFLISCGENTVWSATVESLDTLRPAYVASKALYWSMLHRVFSSEKKAGSIVSQTTLDGGNRSVLVSPIPLVRCTPVARVDVRTATASGNASVVVCTFHCSLWSPLTTPPSSSDCPVELGEVAVASANSNTVSAISRVFRLIASDLNALANLHQEIFKMTEVCAELERRLVSAATAHASDKEALLIGFVAVLNEKKHQIRYLSEKLEEMKKSERVQWIGSGHASDDTRGGDSDSGEQRLASPSVASSDSDVREVVGTAGSAPAADGDAATLVNRRKRSRESRGGSSGNLSGRAALDAQGAVQSRHNSFEHLLSL